MIIWLSGMKAKKKTSDRKSVKNGLVYQICMSTTVLTSFFIGNKRKRAVMRVKMAPFAPVLCSDRTVMTLNTMVSTQGKHLVYILPSLELFIVQTHLSTALHSFGRLVCSTLGRSFGTTVNFVCACAYSLSLYSYSFHYCRCSVAVVSRSLALSLAFTN